MRCSYGDDGQLIVANNCAFAPIMAFDAIPFIWHVVPYEGVARIP
jgi:hypothetical protein